MSANNGEIRTQEGEVGPLVLADGGPDGILSNPTQRWRVKLYQLQDGDWNDRGTGLCWGSILGSSATISVQDEVDTDKMLIESSVCSETRYQRHNALIIWKVDDVELALSFQEVLGCITLCEFLVYVHQILDPSVQLLSCSSTADGGADLSELITSRLPPLPTRSNLHHVNELVAQAAETQYGHEALLAYFGSSEYPKHILSLFCSTKADSALSSTDRLDILHGLSSLIKQLLLFGESTLLEALLEDEVFVTVLDILEYDEEFGRKKANYRHFFEKQARFRQVVPIHDENIVEKIKKTFRLQLLKDVVLARLMDDTSFHMISSLIFMNQIEIIVWMQSTPQFSNALFGLYDPKSGDLQETEARDEGLRFTAHLTATSRPFQPAQRVTLYLIMVENGLFSVLNYGLSHSDRHMRNLALEIVGTILEADANVVWLDAAHRYNSRVINSLITIFNTDKDMGLRRQACEALKALLESPPGLPSDPELLFYEESAPALFNGLVNCQLDGGSKRSQYSELALELLGFCLRKRPEETVLLMEELNIFSTIAQLIETPPSKAALLAALRCVRSFLVACTAERAGELVEPSDSDKTCLKQVLKMMVRLGNVNNAVHSGGLELLVMIALSSQDKYAKLRRWLAIQPELPQLDYIPCTRTILASTRLSSSPTRSGVSDEESVPQNAKPGDEETSEDEDFSKKRPVDEADDASDTTPNKRSRESLNSGQKLTPRRSLSLPSATSPPETPPRLSPKTPPPASRRAMRVMSTPPATRQPSTHETLLKLGNDAAPGPGTPRPRERQNLRKRLVAAKKFMLSRNS